MKTPTIVGFESYVSGFIIYALLIVSLTFSTSLVQGKELDGNEFLMRLKQIDAKDGTERREVASELLAQLQLIESYYPTLTDSDERWLEKEAAALASLTGEAWLMKQIQYSESPFYQLNKLRETLAGITQSLSCVVSAEDEPRREKLCWAVVAFGLTEDSTFNEAIAVLNKTDTMKLSKDIYEKTELVDFEDKYWLRYRLVGRYVQSFVLIPLLLDAVPERVD